ncbi:hypothetical protein [Paracraurococcus ruber]|uniref:Uncharacterized protein n=1 Tax=Paracraurococcus ruber TaxID=77675 RepID=A0ABS1D294_9PROT|nr:hypothetical protein [Paracraurococcus ruber]MBK1660676.1 hypothetical protein [Paracraurococcus ruber]TDG27199.1 hypothetical protein E2C05_23720 [Paracraurococcus ruber]
MLPIDLRALQDLASRAITSISCAIEDVLEDSQRGYLLEAMRALDDIESTLETAFEMTLDVPGSDAGIPALRIVSSQEAGDIPQVA